MKEIFIGLHNRESVSPYFTARTDGKDCDCCIDLSDMVGALPSTLGSTENKLNSYLFKPNLTSKIPKGVNILGNIFFVESNSAHHISYYLAKNAFDRCSPEVPKAVVNFDQHDDYGNCKRESELFCGNWGSEIRKHGADYYVTGSYVSGGESCVVSFKQKNGASSIASKGININAELLDVPKNVYVTVDMDVLKGTDRVNLRTNWKNGGMTVAQLKEKLNETLANVNVVAADITGFPLISRCGVSDRESYIRDIEEIAGILKGFIRAPLLPSPPAE